NLPEGAVALLEEGAHLLAAAAEDVGSARWRDEREVLRIEEAEPARCVAVDLIAHHQDAFDVERGEERGGAAHEIDRLRSQRAVGSEGLVAAHEGEAHGLGDVVRGGRRLEAAMSDQAAVRATG